MLDNGLITVLNIKEIIAKEVENNFIEIKYITKYLFKEVIEYFIKY